MKKAVFLVLLCLLLPYRIEAFTAPQISVGDRFVYSLDQEIREIDEDGQLIDLLTLTLPFYNISITEISDEEVTFIQNTEKNDQSVDYDCLGNIFTSPDWSYWNENIEEEFVTCRVGVSDPQINQKIFNMEEKIFWYTYFYLNTDGNVVHVEKTRDYMDTGVVETHIDTYVTVYEDNSFTIHDIFFNLTLSYVQNVTASNTFRISGFQILFAIPILALKRQK